MLLCCSVAQSCPTLCNRMDYSTLGFPVLQLLLEFAQTQIHWVDDAIQPSHPLSPPSPFAFSLSQIQGLFQCISSYIRWPKYWNFSISPSNEYSGLISCRISFRTLLSLQFRGLSKVFSSTIIWKHQFFGAQPSLQSNSHPYTTMGKNHSFDICQMFVCKVMSLLFNMLCRIVIAFFSKEQASFNFMAVGTVLWFWSPRT